jgi:hypothetical protein
MVLFTTQKTNCALVTRILEKHMLTSGAKVIVGEH